MSGVVAVVALVGAAGCALGWWCTAARVRGAERRLARLERELHDRVLPGLDEARRESAAAAVAAGQAARAAGIEAPPPALAAEAITGPVVRAVAFGAGAHRAVTRLARGLVPGGRARQRTAPRARVGSRR